MILKTNIMKNQALFSFETQTHKIMFAVLYKECNAIEYLS